MENGIVAVVELRPPISVMQIDEDVDGIEQSDQMLREIGDGIDAQIRPGCLMRATRRYGAFATLTLRAIAKIKAGELEADKAAAHFEQVARNHRLRDAGTYDPYLIDMLITRVRHTKRAS